MARGSVHVYSFKNVICAIGSHMPSGFAADNCITITEQGDGITAVSYTHLTLPTT